jgi:hypothetical protein
MVGSEQLQSQERIQMVSEPKIRPSILEIGLGLSKLEWTSTKIPNLKLKTNGQ